MKTILFLFLLVILVMCDHVDLRLHFTNLSGNKTFVSYSLKDSLNITIWAQENRDYIMTGESEFLPNGKIRLPNETASIALRYNQSWEGQLKDTSDYVYIYAIDVDAFKKTEGTLNDSMVIVYKLNLEDIKRLNWNIIYPPGARMEKK